MPTLNINSETIKNTKLPQFSIEVNSTKPAAIYSDVDLQTDLANVLRQNTNVSLFDYQDGLYQRLTVQGNITFFHKWFGCQMPIAEVLVMFHLQNAAKTPLHKCSISEFRRIQYAKQYMTGAALSIFQEPIHRVDVRTINTFINMVNQMRNEQRVVLILVSTMEHALLLSETAYHLQGTGLHELESDSSGEEGSAETPTSLTVEKLFKVPAKVEDKLILFDPTEIDYIESQDGKALIVINDESFALDSSLSTIEKKLELYGFYRCHRSYIVNLQKVREIITWSKNTYSLKINNTIQSTIPLSRTKLQTIQEIFTLK